MDLKISIAMATYNGAKYLQAQLESFVAQTERPTELVVCDDRSTDETVSILQRFSAAAPFSVRIYQNASNLGFVQNFARAISLCGGDLIFLSDQDDVWLSHKLEIISDSFKARDQPLVVINDAELMDSDGERLGITKSGQTRSAGSASEDMITGCCTAFRADLRSVVLPIPNDFGSHDEWIHGLARPIGKRTFLPEVLQLYRRHDANVSNSVTSKTHRISWRDRVVMRLHGTSTGYLRSKLENNAHQIEMLVTRLAERGAELLDLAGLEEDAAGMVLARLEMRKEFASKRMELLGRSRVRRVGSVYRCWRSGQYAHAAGWKSALKDCLLRKDAEMSRREN